jgi:hypothetical protein
MYQASIPVMIRMLGNLKRILKKAERYAAAKKIDPSVLLSARLAPDMFPLTRQIQIASDNAKGCAARLAGRKPPVFKDVEKNFPQLYQRIDRTVAFLKKANKRAIANSENREVVLKFPSMTVKFNGLDYLNHFVLPNFYFHVTTAYAILRHNGVAIGKRDYLGPR